MTTVTLNLPDEIVEKAKARGLLNDETITELLRRSMDEASADVTAQAFPPGYDPRLAGKISPTFFGQGKILGDIVEPLDVEWKANS